MKFLVSRTSNSDENSQPCEGVVLQDYIRIDERTTDDPLKNPNIGPSWYLSGRNHRVENGRIRRDFDTKGWFIEISSIEELVKFIEKNGRIVFGKSYWNDGYVEIEIYDSYRE